MKTTTTHDITIDENTILALYTPGNGNPVTRSVLLCRLPHPSDGRPPPPCVELPRAESVELRVADLTTVEEAPAPLVLRMEEPEQYVMVDHLQLALCISVPRDLPVEALCRFMQSSYCWVHFGAERALETEEQYSSCADARHAVPLMHRVEQENQEDFATYQSAQRRARYDERYDVERDEALQNMPNVRFLRDIRQFQARGPEFKLEDQYRLQLDNHRVLLHFVRRFRKPVKCNDVEYAVRLMDPVLNSNALWSAQEAPEHYVERQLNSRENPSFVHTLRFTESQTLRDGLLWPGLLDERGRINFAQALRDNTVAQMRASSRVDLTLGFSKYRAQLAYNKYLIDVGRDNDDDLVLHRVDYARRQSRLGYTAATLTKKAKKAASADDETKAAVQKRKPDQAALEQFFPRKTVKLNC